MLSWRRRPSCTVYEHCFISRVCVLFVVFVLFRLSSLVACLLVKLQSIYFIFISSKYKYATNGTIQPVFIATKQLKAYATFMCAFFAFVFRTIQSWLFRIIFGIIDTFCTWILILKQLNSSTLAFRPFSMVVESSFVCAKITFFCMFSFKQRERERDTFLPVFFFSFLFRCEKVYVIVAQSQRQWWWWTMEFAAAQLIHDWQTRQRVRSFPFFYVIFRWLFFYLCLVQVTMLKIV